MSMRLLLLLAPLLACRGEPASAADCREILDRIVALELAEQGYRDPALTERKQAAFAARFAAELARCEGVPLPPGARACVAAAGSSEQISHECLH
jgi:hypothetical protein